MKKTAEQFQKDLKEFTSLLEKEGKNLLKQVKNSSSAIVKGIKEMETGKEIGKTVTANYKKIEPKVKEYSEVLQKEIKKLSGVFKKWEDYYSTTKSKVKNTTKKVVAKGQACKNKVKQTAKKARPKTSSRG